MSVTRTCQPGSNAVMLAASAGEYLHYAVVSAGPTVQYVLSDGRGGTLLDRAAGSPPVECRWPEEGAAPDAGEHRHALSMQFFGDEDLVYEVRRFAGDGSELEVVKQCTFGNVHGSDEFFESLRIFVS